MLKATHHRDGAGVVDVVGLAGGGVVGVGVGTVEGQRACIEDGAAVARGRVAGEGGVDECDIGLPATGHNIVDGAAVARGRNGKIYYARVQRRYGPGDHTAGKGRFRGGNRGGD